MSYVSIIINCALVIINLLCLLWYIRRHRLIKRLEQFPGPPPVSFYGNAPDVGSPSTILSAFLRFHQNYGDTIKLFIGPLEVMLVTTDRKFLEFIFNSTKALRKSKQYTYLKHWLGNGLVLADADHRWESHRRSLVSALHSGTSTNFINTVENMGRILVRKLNNEIENPSIDVYPYVSLCTLDILCRTIMGTCLNSQENSEDAYVYNAKMMSDVVVERMFYPLYDFKLFYCITHLFLKERKVVKMLRKYTDFFIHKRKEHRQLNKGVSEIDAEINKKKQVILDVLLESDSNRECLSYEDIREQVDTLMFMGHETTSSAISFAMYLLALSPRTQEKAVQELRELFSDDKGRCATMADLENMKYLDLIIKETLRMFPSIPYYARELVQDVEYEGTVLPKGLTIVINAFGMHRRPDIFDKPREFKPERFTPENSRFYQPYDYIPFSAGPRNCIGQKFAELLMKHVLSTLLRNFEFVQTSPKHKLEIVTETVIKSKNGICVQLRNRNF